MPIHDFKLVCHMALDNGDILYLIELDDIYITSFTISFLYLILKRKVSSFVKICFLREMRICMGKDTTTDIKDSLRGFSVWMIAFSLGIGIGDMQMNCRFIE